MPCSLKARQNLKRTLNADKICDAFWNPLKHAMHFKSPVPNTCCTCWVVGHALHFTSRWVRIASCRLRVVKFCMAVFELSNPALQFCVAKFRLHHSSCQALRCTLTATEQALKLPRPIMQFSIWGRQTSIVLSAPLNRHCTFDAGKHAVHL